MPHKLIKVVGLLLSLCYPPTYCIDYMPHTAIDNVPAVLGQPLQIRFSFFLAVFFFLGVLLLCPIFRVFEVRPEELKNVVHWQLFSSLKNVVHWQLFSSLKNVVHWQLFSSLKNVVQLFSSFCLNDSLRLFEKFTLQSDFVVAN